MPVQCSAVQCSAVQCSAVLITDQQIYYLECSDIHNFNKNEEQNQVTCTLNVKYSLDYTLVAAFPIYDLNISCLKHYAKVVSNHLFEKPG